MKTFFQAFRLFLVLTILTGAAYPALVTVLAQKFFPGPASGSLIRTDGRLTGSELLAQKFSDEKYFWPRPSASDFAAVPSGASNLGPTSAALKDVFEKRKAEFRIKNRLDGAESVPSEMLFASASGLDPHISPDAARLQAGRVAAARGLDKQKVLDLVAALTEPPQYGIFGQNKVNVLKINLALDKL